jgi:uncharacterized membrane protein
MKPLAQRPAEFLSSSANDVSADGSIIVGTITAPFPRAFRWTADGGLGRLGGLPGRPESFGSSVSADGSVVVGDAFSDAGIEAFRWTASTGMVALGDLPGGMVMSSATDVSANGSLIVGYGDTDNGRQAMFWTEATGMVNVQQFLSSNGISAVADWKLISTEGISADGRTIVGTGINPAGLREAWIATIPEPSTLGLAVVCGLGLVAVCVKRRWF